MSGRAGEMAAAGRGGRGGGGRGRGGRGDHGGRGHQRAKHRSTIKELGKHIFDTGRLEDAGKFVKSKEALVNYVQMSSDNEASFVAESLSKWPWPDRPGP